MLKTQLRRRGTEDRRDGWTDRWMHGGGAVLKQNGQIYLNNGFSSGERAISLVHQLLRPVLHPVLRLLHQDQG